MFDLASEILDEKPDSLPTVKSSTKRSTSKETPDALLTTTDNTSEARLTFRDLGVHEAMLRAVDEMGFQYPTPIQELVLSRFNDNTNDIIALAQTGTGKTAAFGLSTCGQIDSRSTELQILVITPTRELCNQVATELTNYTKYIGLRITAVYGGASMDKQLREIRRQPHVLVATPGRLVDLLERGAIDLSAVKYAILDEADEMLNMGFKEDLNTILDKTPQQRRTLLFSATMPNDVAQIAKRYMKNSIELSTGTRNAGAETVEHEYYIAHAKDKYAVLRRIIDVNPGMYGIVFCRTRQETQDVATKLIRDGYNAEPLHGDMNQAARENAMEKFRIRNLQMLIATDVAARGIDVSSLTHVINYSLPESPEIYNHRSGRTGRAGSKGISATIVNMHERGKIRIIERVIKREFIQKNIPSGDQIRTIRLANHIDTVLSYKINSDYQDEVITILQSKLAGVDAEELITKFVMMEFTRILKDYANAPDLNVSFKHEPRTGRYDDDRSYGRSNGGRGGNSSNDRYGNKDRFNNRQDRFNDRNKDSRPRREYSNDSRAGASNARPTESRRNDRGDNRGNGEKAQSVRLALNTGARNKMNAGKFLGMLNDAVGHTRINVDNISVEQSSTYFTVNRKFAKEIMDGFQQRFSSNSFKVVEI